MKDIKNKRSALFSMGTVTRAQRAQRLLADNGIKSFVEKTTSESGCTFSLRVSENDYPKASGILRRINP